MHRPGLAPGLVGNVSESASRRSEVIEVSMEDSQLPPPDRCSQFCVLSTSPVYLSALLVRRTMCGRRPCFLVFWFVLCQDQCTGV